MYTPMVKKTILPENGTHTHTLHVALLYLKLFIVAIYIFLEMFSDFQLWRQFTFSNFFFFFFFFCVMNTRYVILAAKC